MDTLPALSPINAANRVQERNGGNRGSAQAFRRAMQEQASEQSSSPDTVNETAVRPGLQRRADNGRKQDGATCHHVDVLA